MNSLLVSAILCRCCVVWCLMHSMGLSFAHIPVDIGASRSVRTRNSQLRDKTLFIFNLKIEHTNPFPELKLGFAKNSASGRSIGGVVNSLGSLNGCTLFESVEVKKKARVSREEEQCFLIAIAIHTFLCAQYIRLLFDALFQCVGNNITLLTSARVQWSCHSHIHSCWATDKYYSCEMTIGRVVKWNPQPTKMFVLVITDIPRNGIAPLSYGQHNNQQNCDANRQHGAGEKGRQWQNRHSICCIEDTEIKTHYSRLRLIRDLSQVSRVRVACDTFRVNSIYSIVRTFRPQYTAPIQMPNARMITMSSMEYAPPNNGDQNRKRRAKG